MSLPFPTKLPEILTNKGWQKQKSIVDKLSDKTKTGIGDLLLKLEAAWNKANFDALDVDVFMAKNAQKKSSEGLTEGKAEALKESQRSLKLIEQTLTLLGFNASVAEKNKDLSKNAVAALGEMRSKASFLRNTIEAFAFKEWDKAIAEAKKQEDEGRKKYVKALNELRVTVGSLEHEPTAAMWAVSQKEMEKEFAAMSGPMLNFSRSGTGESKSWQDVSSSIKSIEQAMVDVIKGLKSKGKDDPTTLIEVFAFKAKKQIAIMEKVAK